MYSEYCDDRTFYFFYRWVMDSYPNGVDDCNRAPLQENWMLSIKSSSNECGITCVTYHEVQIKYGKKIIPNMQANH